MEASISVDKRFCACGCGNDVTGKTSVGKIRQYTWGHNRRGRFHPNSIRRVPAEQHHFWKGGRYTDNNGYIRIRCIGHPRATKLGFYVSEHGLVMERFLGRYLWDFEVVHHKDGNRQNNDINNLELMTRGEHTSLHKSRFV